MNILFLLGDSGLKGGTERSTIEVANKLSNNLNNKIFILSIYRCASNDPFVIYKNVIQKSLYNSKPITKNIFFKILFYFNTIYRLLIFVRRNKVDFLVSVEAMSVIFTFPVVCFLRLFGDLKKYVVWEHFNFTVNLDLAVRDFCRKIAARNADVIVTLTDKDKSIWCENLSIKGKILSIPNPSPFAITDKIYDKHSKTIVAIGRLVPQKGFDMLIDVWKYLYDNYEVEDGWILQIIGDGPEYLDLEQKINNNNNLKDKITIIPSNNQISKFYENASFLCMTSRFEGLPMTLIEAQSFGLPIISYNCITGPEEIISNESGFLVDLNDFKDFAYKVYCLMNNTEVRCSMSNSAKKEATRFSIKEVLVKWENLIQEN